MKKLFALGALLATLCPKCSVSAAAPASGPAAFTVLTYNVNGNGAASWTTNSPQVRAIARQLQFLAPDIVTFQEIPNDYTYEMTNFIAAFLPGYALVTNSATDGYIRAAIASRFPITRSKSWLARTNLSAFGYTSGVFTRDLFEAQIAVPGFDEPLHVFTAHLKAGTTTDDLARRAAESAAISNLLVTTYRTNFGNHPYLLTGDLNESDTNQQSIQRLVSPPTGLQLTKPVNPLTGSHLTHSIQSVNGLTRRFDYIMPDSLLSGHIVSSQVFRSDLYTNPPAPLLRYDDTNASDHLPVLMSFDNPYPFRLLSCSASGQDVTLVWQSIPSRFYGVEQSSNLIDWVLLSDNVPSTGAACAFTTPGTGFYRFFRVYRAP